MFWRLAWRNLWRNRRRTLLTMAAISLGLTVLITFISFMEGSVEIMMEQVARSSVGHVQLHHPDYLEKRSATLVMADACELVAAVEAVPGVAATSQRLLLSGAIRSSRAATVRVVRVMAVDPGRERQLSALAGKVVEGGFLVPPPESLAPDAPPRVRQRKGILIGRKLAALLKVELGSKVRIDCAGFGGATTAAAFFVTGIMATGAESFDSQVAMVALADLQEATGAGDIVHEVAVIAGRQVDPGQLAVAIREQLARREGSGAQVLSVLPWYEVMPEISRMIESTRAANGLLYMLMMVVLSAGILTTMFMVVFERRREFGVQLALGTRPALLFAGVTAEALFISLLATGGGVLLALPVVAWLTTTGLDLSAFMEGIDFAGSFIDNVYRGSAAPKVFVEPALVVCLGTVVVTLWPAMKVARMKALEAIRQGGAA